MYGYNPSGPDYLLFQKGPVGTRWTEQIADGSHRVTEIVAMEPVTVPYGTFSEAYVFCSYYCLDPDNLSLGRTPDVYEWFVPGIARVKEVDYWNENPPMTAVLVGVTAVPAPVAILLGTLGTGLVGWLRRRRTL